MDLLEIENAIKTLSPEEVSKLIDWLAEYHAELWDEAIADDLEAGRLDAILCDVERTIDLRLGKSR